MEHESDGETNYTLYMEPMWLPYYFCSLSICIYTVCLNIRKTYVTTLLFLLTQYM